MESTRQKKVSRLVQKEVGEIFLKRGKEFLPGKMCSVTIVRLSPDLSVARIYVSILPSDSLKEDVEHLNKIKSTIRHDMGNAMRRQLRIIPDLTFFPDDSLDYIDNLNRLLKD